MVLMDPIAAAIEDSWAVDDQGPPRSYIGASGVGHPCDANLAFSLRGFPDTPPPPHLKRIFRDGHRIEAQVVADLRRAGFFVWDRDPDTGRQFEYTEFGRHIICHTDGMIEVDHRWPGHQVGDVALLEIKSMNANNWAKFSELGVRASHPQYYWQMQLMMGLSGISVCLFVAYCKDNSRYKSEICRFRDTDYAFLSARIEAALQNRAAKISADEADWRCRECFKRDACWQGKAPVVTCRTCKHAAADPDHVWWCLWKSEPATVACGDYVVFHPNPKE